jgi:hypothetical protein
LASQIRWTGFFLRDVRMAPRENVYHAMYISSLFSAHLWVILYIKTHTYLW